MRALIKSLLCLILFGFPIVPATANTSSYSLGKWNISVDNASGDVGISNNQLTLDKIKITFKVGDTQYWGSQLTDRQITTKAVSSAFGEGQALQIEGTLQSENTKVTQLFYSYPDKDYLLTEVILSSESEIRSNYIAPVYMDSPITFLSATGDNQSLTVPWDNDSGVRFGASTFGSTTTSYEVGALYDNIARNGLVIGSVEHDNWKTGIRITTTRPNTITKIEAFGGITSSLTRDTNPHGAVKGTSVKSPLMFIGYFDDWRSGMEIYGDANTIVAPRLPYDGGKPFGWNSWGELRSNISYAKAVQVSNYFASTLQNNSFAGKDGLVYIGLDSYWDNMSANELMNFVNNCKSQGQKAGIYFSPFCDWSKNGENSVSGTTYKYKDLYIYAGGKPQELDGAYALDPTHPGTQAIMDTYIRNFKRQGFEYVKLDFMNLGALEGDSYYDPNVTTGIQAYNAGMKFILEKIDGTMYMNLSISPVFPANIAHSRRISCDAFYNISSTGYVINCLTGGWWIDHAYYYNDPDQIVFNKGTDTENRARMTSGVITGILLNGDDLSDNGPSGVRSKAQTLLTNREINRMALNTKSFRPVEGNNGSNASNLYYSTYKDTIYVALINYTFNTITLDINFRRIGLNPGTDYNCTELWSGVKSIHNNSWSVTLNGADAQIFKMYKESGNGIKNPEVVNSLRCYPNPCPDYLNIETGTEIEKIFILSVDGRIMLSAEPEGLENAGLDVSGLNPGIYFVSVQNKDGSTDKCKIIKN
ncbi:MAG: T9SS type A sorting domain-containing protein [Candidatus Azobacteroides sp.]|nr:T9SS type A sorting domain-containing protein [Candidatus Azobacteroides sp.]